MGEAIQHLEACKVSGICEALGTCLHSPRRHTLRGATVKKTQTSQTARATAAVRAIIFDYQSLAGLVQAQTRRNYVYAVLSRISGERRDFGIEQNQIEDYLTRRGFTYVVSVNADQLKSLYCTGPNQGRTVAENYAIVHAQVGESRV